MLRTDGRRQPVDAAGVRAHLGVSQVPVAEQHRARATSRRVPGGPRGRRRGDHAWLGRAGQVAVGGVRVVGVGEEGGAAAADVDVEAVDGVRLYEHAEAVDAVDGLLQLVRTLVLLRVLQRLGAERAQQQRQEQVQHLHNGLCASVNAP